MPSDIGIYLIANVTKKLLIDQDRFLAYMT